MAKTFYILRDIHDLLQILVLPVVEDRVVYDDAVDVGIGIGSQDGLFDVVARDFTKSITESAVGKTSTLTPDEYQVWSGVLRG